MKNLNNKQALKNRVLGFGKVQDLNFKSVPLKAYFHINKTTTSYNVRLQVQDFLLHK